MDTQWPRYQVFIQEKPEHRHQDAGSVHAIDSEMALQNARDVFARRPECVSIWVVPADLIYAITREELESWIPEPISEYASEAGFYVFCKLKSSGAAQHVGEIMATGHQSALVKALQTYKLDPSPYLWWIIPKEAVTRSYPEDIHAMFMPAYDKPFRQSSYYHVITEMRQVQRSADLDPQEGPQK